MSRPGKHLDLLNMIRACVEDGRYLDTRHATERKTQRMISRPELLYVLKYGRHEKAKDKFDEAYNAWNYAIRGKTLDRRELRIVVSFDENGMLIITAIDLTK